METQLSLLYIEKLSQSKLDGVAPLVAAPLVLNPPLGKINPNCNPALQIAGTPVTVQKF